MAKLFSLFLAFLMLLNAQARVTSTRKSYDSNPDLSALIRSKLTIDVLSWDHGENPVIEFSIDKEGKVKNLNFKKKRNRYNANICVNDLIAMEPFAEAFREQAHSFECRPDIEVSRREFKDIKKYTQKYFKQVYAKIRANWFPDPRKNKLSALVSFDINKEGQVENLQMLESSKDDAFDKLAKKAIEMSSPFSVLDEKAFTFTHGVEKLNVIFQFDNRLDERNRLRSNAGFSVGSFGSGLGVGLNYGRGRMIYPGYPFWW